MIPEAYSSFAGPTEYNAWNNIKSRCNNQNHPQRKDYGGRGITVCDRWINSFEDFVADVGRSPGPEYSIDRKDNSKGYEPGNVRWATKVEQARNARNNHLIAFRGQTLCAAAWAEKLNLPRSGKAIIDRLNLGWSVEEALTIPIGGGRKRSHVTHCKHGHAYTRKTRIPAHTQPGINALDIHIKCAAHAGSLIDVEELFGNES